MSGPPCACSACLAPLLLLTSYDSQPLYEKIMDEEGVTASTIPDPAAAPIAGSSAPHLTSRHHPLAHHINQLNNMRTICGLSSLVQGVSFVCKRASSIKVLDGPAVRISRSHAVVRDGRGSTSVTVLSSSYASAELCLQSPSGKALGKERVPPRCLAPPTMRLQTRRHRNHLDTVRQTDRHR